MTNEELIAPLTKSDMLSLAQLLTHALLLPEESIQDIAEQIFFDLPVEVFEYCEEMTNDYQCLKLLQLVVNTLVKEAETATVQGLQLDLLV